MAYDREPAFYEPALTPALHERWSPRALDPEHEVSDQQLRLLLEAARWSPSAGNGQPWAFLAGRRGEPVFETIVEHASRGNKAWIPRASALLATVAKTGPSSEEPTDDWEPWHYYDLGQAVAHLTVQAHALGLFVHQFAGFKHALVQEALGVPAGWRVMTGVAIGVLGDASTLDEITQAKEQAPRQRKALDEFVFAGSWGEPAPWASTT